jgi:LPS-assembly lipoprotein
MKMPMRAGLPTVLLLTLLLGACGFHLRGQAAFALPFQTLYVKSANGFAPFITELKHAIEVNGVGITETPQQAQLTLDIVSESTDRQILSLSASGRVLEYRLYYRVSYQAYDNKRRDWLAPDQITLQRDFSWDDAQVIAKEQEQTLLYQDMRSDAVQQMLRRLNHVKVPL